MHPIDSEELPVWPAAERNKGPILEVLSRWLPDPGRVLEIASGTGQHAAHFAENLPHLTWLPSDRDPAHLRTLEGRRGAYPGSNLEAPLGLDVTRAWPNQEPLDAIYCANMIHIAPWEATLGLLDGAGAWLRPGGALITYGPYTRGGQHTSESNANFDNSLRRRDPRWGVRDMDEIATLAAERSLELAETLAMPANNFMLRFHKRS